MLNGTKVQVNICNGSQPRPFTAGGHSRGTKDDLQVANGSSDS